MPRTVGDRSSLPEGDHLYLLLPLPAATRPAATEHDPSDLESPTGAEGQVLRLLASREDIPSPSFSSFDDPRLWADDPIFAGVEREEH